jgi:hypothetical protein
MPRVANPPLFLLLACGLGACANDASPKASKHAAPATSATAQTSPPASPAEYACIAAAMTVPAAPLDDVPSVSPSPETAGDLADAMDEIADAFGCLYNIRAAQWQAPADDPDIVPAAEARRLTDNLRFAGEAPDAQALGEDFSRLLIKSIESASALEELIARSAPAAEAEAAFKLVEASCNECHTRFQGVE